MRLDTDSEALRMRDERRLLLRSSFVILFAEVARAAPLLTEEALRRDLADVLVKYERFVEDARIEDEAASLLASLRKEPPK